MVGTELIPKLHAMHLQEPAMQAQTGIDPAMVGYIARASAAYRLSVYSRYLDESELEQLRAIYRNNQQAWPPLIALVRRLMQQGVAPSDPEAQTAAQTWLGLTSPFFTDGPATRAKMRRAAEEVPDLLNNTGIDRAMIQFLRTAAGLENGETALGK
jgi:hypothetical protein